MTKVIVKKTAGKGQKITVIKKERTEEKEKIEKRAQLTQLMTSMNEAALEAEEEFKELPKAVRQGVKDFFIKWYPKAGYKKLGKMIVGKPFITEVE